MATSGNFEDWISVALTTTETIGTCELREDMVGMYGKSGVSGDSVPFKIRGRLNDVVAATGTGEDWTQGDKLYFDNTAKGFTTTATGNTLCAIAAADKTTAAATGDVILTGQVV